MNLSDNQIKELFTEESENNSPYSFLAKSKTFLYIVGMSLFGKLLCPREYEEFTHQFKVFEDWVKERNLE